MSGRVHKHFHREPSWPDGACVPYQVLLDDTFCKGPSNAVYAPADDDECIRAALRFRVGDSVDCWIGESWARGKVVAHFYREEGWKEGRYAPYQVRLNEPELFPDDRTSEVGSVRLELSGGQLIWAPDDTDEYIRVQL